MYLIQRVHHQRGVVRPQHHRVGGGGLAHPPHVEGAAEGGRVVVHVHDRDGDQARRGEVVLGDYLLLLLFNIMIFIYYYMGINMIINVINDIITRDQAQRGEVVLWGELS